MASLLESKLGFGMACVLGAAFGVVGIVYLRQADPPAAAPARTASWDGPVGPGALAVTSPADSGAGGPPSSAPMPGEQPLLDATGRLLVDPALHRLFDSFLKNGAGGAPREQELRAYLKRRLVSPALTQAEGMAADYARYLKAEAALRANERFSPLDRAGLSPSQVEQMLAWQQQRAQLRERMLGAAVSQAWFGTEDADCRTALTDWRTMRAPVGSEEVDSNELRDRRLHGAMLEQRRNERAQSCASQLMDRLAVNGPAA
jgi:lipase chaperone LimK